VLAGRRQCRLIAAERQRDRRAAPGRKAGEPYQHERDHEERRATVYEYLCEPEQRRCGDRYEHGVEDEIDDRRQPFADVVADFVPEHAGELTRAVGWAQVGLSISRRIRSGRSSICMLRLTSGSTDRNVSSASLFVRAT
jgi:hypothetical protein